MKRYTVLVAAVMLLISGCDRTIDSKNPLRSVPDPAPMPTNVQVLVSSESIMLDWTVPDSSNVSRYRIYVADTLPVDFRLQDSSANSAAILTGLLINRLYYMQIAAVDRGGLEGVASAPVSATIGYTSIAINGGATFTRTREVAILVNSSAPASQVILSEDSTFADAFFVPWAPERSFTLSPGDTVKTVYGRVVFSDGSRTGALLEDRITLDTRSEIDSVFIIPAATTFAEGDVVTFGLNSSELFGQASVSFTGVTGLALFDNGSNGDDIANDGIYHGHFEVPVNTNLYRDVVTGSFTDAAGNEALPVGGNQLLNINTPPDPVNLALTVNALGEYEFSWTLSLEPDFESYRIYSNSTPTVNTTHTLLAIVTDPLVSLYAAAAPGTTTYYRIFVFDQHGSAAGSNVVP